MSKYKSLSDFVQHMYSNSCYVFTTKQALSVLDISKDALKVALNRLIHKKQIAKLRAGHYVIVPVEYSNTGAPPPTWYIDTLMKALGLPYYIGILTSAAFHGAAHQQPQIFQVITTKAMRDMVVCNSRIRFIRKKQITDEMYTVVNTPTGTMNIATPEMTAFDLVLYQRHAGYLNNIATVLQELSEVIDEDKLAASAKQHIPLPTIQRVSYLIENYGEAQVTNKLYEWLIKEKPTTIPLRTGKSTDNVEKDEKWLVWINEKIEVDL